MWNKRYEGTPPPYLWAFTVQPHQLNPVFNVTLFYIGNEGDPTELLNELPNQIHYISSYKENIKVILNS